MRPTDPYVPMDQVTYLGRSFRQTRDWCYAPLKHTAMAYMLVYLYKTDSKLKQKEAIRSTLRSFLEESWHHGKEQYQKSVEYALNVAERAGVTITAMDWDMILVLRRAQYLQ